MSLLHFAAFLVNNRSDLALHTEHLDIILVVRGLEIYDKSTEKSCRPSSKSAQTSHPNLIPHINRLYHKSYQQKAYRLHTAGQNRAQQFQPNRQFATFCCKDKTLRIFKRSRGKVFVLRQGIRKDF
jgi:hypothetical protein